MVKTYEGALNAKGLTFGIVVSRFNEFFSKKLLEGALDCLQRHGADEKSIAVAWVPGGFEIPLAAKKMADSKKYDAVIALGALIRGNTPHFEYIAAEVAKGLATAAHGQRPARHLRRHHHGHRRAGHRALRDQSPATRASTPPWPPSRWPTSTRSSDGRFAGKAASSRSPTSTRSTSASRTWPP